MTFEEYWENATSGYKILGGTIWDMHDLKLLAEQTWNTAKSGVFVKNKPKQRTEVKISESWANKKMKFINRKEKT